MIWTIAKREMLARARTKPFIILTIILFLGVIAGAIGISALTGGSDEPTEVIVGLTGDGVQYGDAIGAGNEEFDPAVVEFPDVAAGEADLLEGEIDVLFDGSTLTWPGFPDLSLDATIRNAATQTEFVSRAADLDLDPGELQSLFAEVPIEEKRLDGSEGEQGIRIAAAMVSTVATFFLLQVWGSFLMMGVVEEKSSRVVEVLLSHISARTLLTGKLIGLGILALSQLLILVAGLVLGLSLVRDIEIPDGVWSSVPLLLITFVLGYGFYAALFAAVGSTVSRQEDAQTAQLPAMLPLLVGYGIAASSVSAPDSIVVRIASFIPFTSPVVLPFRVALVDPPLWEIILALVILAGSVPLMLRIAGSIYRTSLLKVGTRIPLMEAFRSRSDT